jgi:chorismate mutase / prephenate dehydratase
VSGGVLESERPADLQALREALEKIDLRLLRLLRERMNLVEGVAEAKLGSAWPFRDPAREDRLLLRLRQSAVEEALDPHEVERLYRVILDMSVAHQQAFVRSLETTPLRVSYQGAEGSYSHLAAQRQYSGRPGGVLLTGCETFRRAAESVLSGEADLALLPIENTTAGSINETYDLLGEGGLTITGEVIAAIEHCLLALPGATLAELGAVLSHPQALAQCEGFFRAHPGIRPQAEFDTAGAARKVKQMGDPALGAIASLAAASTYGLEVLARGIQTQAGNSTRFVEVGLHAVPVTEGARAKSSLLLVLADRPGVLGEILQELARRGLNLTKLESRPIPGNPWSYRFYLDIDGHASATTFQEALQALSALTTELRVLGTYPAAE